MNEYISPKCKPKRSQQRHKTIQAFHAAMPQNKPSSEKHANKTATTQQYSRATNGSTVQLSSSEATISPNLAACCGVQGKADSVPASSSEVPRQKERRCIAALIWPTRRCVDEDCTNASSLGDTTVTANTIYKSHLLMNFLLTPPPPHSRIHIS